MIPLPAVIASEVVPICTDANRHLHGPVIAETVRGDWVVAFQHADDDPGHDGYVYQMRSRDGGHTWTRDGIVSDGRAEEVSHMNPALCRARSGRILLLVQRSDLAGYDRGVRGPARYLSPHLLWSPDEDAHGYGPARLFDPDPPGTFFWAQHLLGTASGLVTAAVNRSEDQIDLWASADDGESWRRVTTIVHLAQVKAASPVDVLPEFATDDVITYPTLIAQRHGALLLIGHHASTATQFRLTSADGGCTWGGLTFLPRVRMRHGLLARLGACLVLVGAQMLPVRHAAYHVSQDEGETWEGPYPLAPQLVGGGYTGAIPTADGRLFVVFSAGTQYPHLLQIWGVWLRMA